MVLLRQLLGDVLRRLRIRQGRTLREVSASARVSLGYLSEVERGRKEASSELLAAICAALETPLSQVFREVSDNFALAELQQDTALSALREPGMRVPAERVPAAAGAPSAAGADLDGVPAMDAMDVASVSGGEFADHRSGFGGPGGSVRDFTDMVTV
jgi:transcriptional regulator with XRE-family HTH domain